MATLIETTERYYTFKERYSVERAEYSKRGSTLEEAMLWVDYKTGKIDSYQNSTRLIEITEHYYVFADNNRYSRSKYTLEQATELVKTLSSCFDCTDCSYCTKCWECSNCHHCTICEFCEYCEHCSDCGGCFGARNIHGSEDVSPH